MNLTVSIKKTMQCAVIFGFLCLQYFNQSVAENVAEYMNKRASWIEKESNLSLGSKVVLTEKEILANNILMQWKKMEAAPNDSHHVIFSGSYFTYRDHMRHSKVYQIIRRMPKGAALHIHGTFMLDPDDFMKYTYEDHLYICLTETVSKFQFSNNTPELPCPVQWTLVKEQRANCKNVTEFDSILKERITLGPEDCIGPYAHQDEAWKSFRNIYSAIYSLIDYRPIREKMIYQSFQNFYDDNIMYIEIRIGELYGLYELNGTKHDQLYTASLYDRIAKDFMKVNPDFVGFKFIITGTRSYKTNVEDVRKDINLARVVKRFLPHAFAGFDIVGNENRGKALIEFLPALLEAKGEIDYFFHAGETNSFGAEADENMFDAILLGTKRIGHGYALVKHPELMKAVFEKDIGVEVNVVSNSVLSLVQDLRNHPLATYLALGLPVVLSSDDPGVWGATPLSDDFYVAFVAVASRHADLRLLKQLAINSITYSALDDKGKTKLFRTFEKQWVKFVNSILDIKTEI